MKKFLSVALVFVLVLSLCACGAKAEEPKKEEGKKLKAGFICLHDENSPYDLNFINAANEFAAKSDVELVIKTNIPADQECYEIACELAESGCAFVFADSFAHEDYVIEAAKAYPDVQFCHATGTKAHTENLPNYHNAFASIFNGRYLAGIVAGMKLNQMISEGKCDAAPKIGYVGAFPFAEIISGYSAYFLGVRSVCPGATMEVTFTNSWLDETAEKEGAQKLIDRGCVLISQHADSMGAPTACETAGVPNVAYNGSTASACPETYLVSSRINWSTYFTFIADSIRSNTAMPSDWAGSFDTDSVSLTELGKNVAPGTQEAIDKAKADIIAGTLHVFDVTKFTVDGKQLDSFMADVDSDAAYERDHEVVVNGYIDESGAGFRSAPFFDANIDGITLIDNN